MTIHDEMRLVAVYDTELEARAAVRALERAGAEVARVRFDDARDHLASVEGEMRSEVVHSIAGPGNVGPFTREMARGSLIGIVIGGVVGLVLALPFAAIGFGSMVLWSRLLLVAIVGAVVGATFGWVIGGGFAARRPQESLAAEGGITVSVPASETARSVLTTTNVRRVDIVMNDGHPISEISARDAGARGTVREIGRNMASEDRRG